MSENKNQSGASNALEVAIVKKKLSNTQKIIIAGLSVIAIIIVIIGIVIINKKPADTSPKDNNGGNFVIDNGNLDALTDLMESNVSEGMFECNMTTTWNFPNGKTASTDAYVANANTNSKPIYFEVVLINSNETVFTSDLIPVGKKIKTIKLDTNLSKGVYNAKCVYHLMDKQDDGKYKEYSQASFSITVAVKS